MRIGALCAPALAVFAAFFLLPLARLIGVGTSGPEGAHAYLAVLVHPRYLQSLAGTISLAAATTVTAVALATAVGLFLARTRFWGRDLLVSVLTLPLAFPGVVVGFFVIMLAGRQGLVGTIAQALGAEKIVFAYSLAGLFLGYLYFSLPRVLLTVMAAAEKLDPSLEEAARTLGAGTPALARDIILPGLAPAIVASAAICFATAMGAFGTAFTLATQLDVLPMTIYTEFTLNADIATAAALSVVLGGITWGTLALARVTAGESTFAAG